MVGPPLNPSAPAACELYSYVSASSSSVSPFAFPTCNERCELVMLSSFRGMSLRDLASVTCNMQLFQMGRQICILESDVLLGGAHVLLIHCHLSSQKTSEMSSPLPLEPSVFRKKVCLSNLGEMQFSAATHKNTVSRPALPPCSLSVCLSLVSKRN